MKFLWKTKWKRGGDETTLGTICILQESRLVSILIGPLERKPLTKVCFLQKWNGGVGQDVWAIDHVQVLRNLPEHGQEEHDRVVQFYLNMQCGNNLENNQ